MKKQYHIIIAEDEDLVAMSLAETLENSGFRVTVTYNGLQALEAENRDRADLLLTDMRMPVMDGACLIKLIRQRREDLPIIVTTGFSEFMPAEEPGLLMVMRKPYRLNQLVDCVRELLPSA